MITRAEAERIAAEAVGPASAGDGLGWTLEEFSAGWLIRQAWMDDGPVRGGEIQIVERDTGRVMRFSSAIALDSIMTDYDQVRAEGFPSEPG